MRFLVKTYGTYMGFQAPGSGFRASLRLLSCCIWLLCVQASPLCNLNPKPYTLKPEALFATSRRRKRLPARRAAHTLTIPCVYIHPTGCNL
jgi:hypothetical protein